LHDGQARSLTQWLVPEFWACHYAITYYLGSITRYRPHHFDSILEGSFGPLVEAFLNDQPAQFRYLTASKFARREVTRAALV